MHHLLPPGFPLHGMSPALPTAFQCTNYSFIGADIFHVEFEKLKTDYGLYLFLVIKTHFKSNK